MHRIPRSILVLGGVSGLRSGRHRHEGFRLSRRSPLLSGRRQMSTTIGISTCCKSNSSRTIVAHSRNPSASAALGRRAPSTRPSDRRDKAIAASDNRGDVSVARLATRQDTAQRSNTDLEIAFSDEGLGPDLRNQLGLAHDLAGAFHKRDQEIEGATADRDGLGYLSAKVVLPGAAETDQRIFRAWKSHSRDQLFGSPMLRWCPAAICADRLGIRNL